MSEYGEYGYGQAYGWGAIDGWGFGAGNYSTGACDAYGQGEARTIQEADIIHRLKRVPPLVTEIRRANNMLLGDANEN